MRPWQLVAGLAALAAIVLTVWLVPSAKPVLAAEDGGCEASGVWLASCQFECRAGEQLSMVLRVEGGWGWSKAVGVATCDEHTASCHVRGTMCMGGLQVGAGPEEGVEGGIGECRARKLPLPFYPGAVHVHCSTEPSRATSP